MSLSILYCPLCLSVCVPEATITSLHPPRLCRLAVFSIKPTLLSFTSVPAVSPLQAYTRLLWLLRSLVHLMGPKEGECWEGLKIPRSQDLLPIALHQGREPIPIYSSYMYDMYWYRQYEAADSQIRYIVVNRIGYNCVVVEYIGPYYRAISISRCLGLGSVYSGGGHVQSCIFVLPPGQAPRPLPAPLRPHLPSPHLLAYLCADMHINAWSRICAYPHVHIARRYNMHNRIHTCMKTRARTCTHTCTHVHTDIQAMHTG